MSPTARRILVVLAAAVLARGALHWATFHLPVSNDDAILLLMGQAVLRGELATTLWNQPYNGALDAYLLAPLLALLPHHAAYRLYQLLAAALLVLLVSRLARRLGGPTAGWAGAFLAAWGTPYMALMTATGPPPNFLMPLVTGFPLARRARGVRGARRGPRAHLLYGARLRPRHLELGAGDPGLRRDGARSRPRRPAAARDLGRRLRPRPGARGRRRSSSPG